uniref:Uncharacterized protein n=1 Tax=Mycena chlorophos TaxID=658473 RepID=A0ABQ0LA76_MYCCL|nr:predicted protein [Mycena chlorophos]
MIDLPQLDPSSCIKIVWANLDPEKFLQLIHAELGPEFHNQKRKWLGVFTSAVMLLVNWSSSYRAGAHLLSFHLRQCTLGCTLEPFPAPPLDIKSPQSSPVAGPCRVLRKRTKIRRYRSACHAAPLKVPLYRRIQTAAVNGAGTGSLVCEPELGILDALRALRGLE